MFTLEQIRATAFNITAGFEGGGYATYQTYDSGLISYGRFQFTLASGSLYTVLKHYIDTEWSDVSTLRTKLEQAYLERVRTKDVSLRNDRDFRNLLVKLAEFPPMQRAQDEIATKLYWQRVLSFSIEPRGITTPLGQALVFDMAINHGTGHDMIWLAETELGIPPKSRLGSSYGVTKSGLSVPVDEQMLITKVAEIRRDRLYRLADARNLQGLKPRGDFWIRTIQEDNWNLVGDADGNLLIKPGRYVKGNVT